MLQYMNTNVCDFSLFKENFQIDCVQNMTDKCYVCVGVLYVLDCCPYA